MIIKFELENLNHRLHLYFLFNKREKIIKSKIIEKQKFKKKEWLKQLLFIVFSFVIKCAETPQ